MEFIIYKFFKTKSHISIIFSLTVFLLIWSLWAIKAPKTEACGAECILDSGVCKSDDTTWGTDHDTCTINIGLNFCDTSFGGASCNSGSGVAQRWCLQDRCPAANNSALNGANCDIMTGKSFGVCLDPQYKANGFWDASKNKCIQCAGKKESGVCGDTATIRAISLPYPNACTSTDSDTNSFETACSSSVSSQCDDRLAGCVGTAGFCDSNGVYNICPLNNCSGAACAAATPTPTPTPTPGGNWIRYSSGGYHAYDCVGGSDIMSNTLNNTSGGSCSSPDKWQNCGNGSPVSGSYNCMVGFSVDCSDPLKRCPDKYYAGDCDCITPTPTATPTGTATPTPTAGPQTVLGCSCGAGCPFGTVITCALTNSTVNTFCIANPTCTLILTTSPNCDCAALLSPTPTSTGTPTGSGTPAPTGSGNTCATGDGCRLACVPPDSDCGSGVGLIPTFLRFSSSNSFDALVQNITGWILGVIGSLALLFLIIGGIMYITAGGDQDRIKTAKWIVTAVVIGLVIIVVSYSIITEVKKILGY